MTSTIVKALVSGEIIIKDLPEKAIAELKEILSTIKCIADDVSPHKEYENTYSDGWLDA